MNVMLCSFMCCHVFRFTPLFLYIIFVRGPLQRHLFVRHVKHDLYKVQCSGISLFAVLCGIFSEESLCHSLKCAELKYVRNIYFGTGTFCASIKCGREKFI